MINSILHYFFPIFMPHYVICIREQPAEQGLLLLVSPIHEYVVHIIDPTGSTRSEVVLCQRTLRGCVNLFFNHHLSKKMGGSVKPAQMCLLGTSFGRFLSFSKLEFVNVRLHANVQARNYHTVSNHVENAPKKTLKPVLCMAYSCIGKTSSGRLDSAGCSLIHMTPCHPKGGKISAIIICCWTF